jgi:hypothetical protein
MINEILPIRLKSAPLRGWFRRLRAAIRGRTLVFHGVVYVVYRANSLGCCGDLHAAGFLIQFYELIVINGTPRQGRPA